MDTKHIYMKRLFMTAFIMDALAETGNLPTAAAETVTSEKLSEIRAKLNDVTAKLAAGGLPTADIIALAGEIGKLQADETTEIAAIKRAKLEAEAEAEKSKRLAEATAKLNDLLAANDAAKTAAADKKLSIDDKNAANANFVSKFDELVNVIMGKPAKTAAAGSSSAKTAASGASDSEIQTAFNTLVAAGKSEADAKKALEADPYGFKRSTIWFAIDRMKNPAKYAK